MKYFEVILNFARQVEQTFNHLGEDWGRDPFFKDYVLFPHKNMFSDGCPDLNSDNPAILHRFLLTAYFSISFKTPPDPDIDGILAEIALIQRSKADDQGTTYWNDLKWKNGDLDLGQHLYFLFDATDSLGKFIFQSEDKIIAFSTPAILHKRLNECLKHAIDELQLKKDLIMTRLEDIVKNAPSGAG